MCYIVSSTRYWPTSTAAGWSAVPQRNPGPSRVPLQLRLEPGRALDASPVATRVIAYLAVVRHHHDRPGADWAEREQRLGHAIADDLVGGGVAGVADREPGRDATAGAAARVAVEDQLDLRRWRERGTQPRDEGDGWQWRGAPARERVLHVATVDEDAPARARIDPSTGTRRGRRPATPRRHGD